MFEFDQLLFIPWFLNVLRKDQRTQTKADLGIHWVRDVGRSLCRCMLYNARQPNQLPSLIFSDFPITTSTKAT